jgi:flotillin
VPTEIIIAVIVTVIVVLGVLSCYKKCPEGKIMVIYGMVKGNDGNTASWKSIRGGAQFVLPLVQDVKYLDLTHMPINVDLTNTLSRDSVRIGGQSRFKVGISTEPETMNNAVERLLGISMTEVQEIASDIIRGQLRSVISKMEIEEINSDRDKLLEAIIQSAESELKKIGLYIIRADLMNITIEKQS